jgi:hypothetical protein
LAMSSRVTARWCGVVTVSVATTSKVIVINIHLKKGCASV